MVSTLTGEDEEFDDIRIRLVLICPDCGDFFIGEESFSYTKPNLSTDERVAVSDATINTPVEKSF